MENKKKEIRKQIISSAIIFKNALAGKVFLYVYGDQYFEVLYRTNCFKHLTGVASYLSAEDFYSKAKTAELATTQIGFTPAQPYRTAKKKLVCMHSLPRLTSDLVCVVKDMSTVTITYKMGITNLEFTIGLMENLDNDGKLINDWLVPRTLRVNDKVVEQSRDIEFVDFIFSKDAASKEYDTLCYAANGKQIPQSIRHMLNVSLNPVTGEIADQSDIPLGIQFV